MRGLALCAGIGGIELGLKIALGERYRTVCYVEREAFCAATLVARMEEKALDSAPIWDDIETFDGSKWRGCVDIVTAGFPCQPFSTASRGRAVARSLWPMVLYGAQRVQPELVFLENVQRPPIGTACSDLRALGYRATYDCFCSSELGCPSPRRRWFALAHLDGKSQLLGQIDAEVGSIQKVDEVGQWVADPYRFLGVESWIPDRMDRLQACGNAVSPPICAFAFTTLSKRLIDHA
jgi:DNA (cytosine-5)-methyltransferase 1